MANLTRTSWPKGWNPSQDDVNGSPEGLLRMDNLRQNEEGVLALTRGSRQLNSSSFSDKVKTIFSKIINGTEYIWAALGDDTSDVRRSVDDFSSSTSVLSSGGNKACFGDALGQVFICAGSKRKKDNGVTVQNLGIIAPLSAPGVNVQNPPRLDFGPDGFSLVAGHDFNAEDDGAKAYTDPTFGAIKLTLPSITDLLNIGDGPSVDPGKDLFSFVFEPHDKSLLTKVTIQVMLGSDLTANNCYIKEFDVQNDSRFIPGIEQGYTITATRDEFTYSSSDSSLDWSQVNGFIASVTSVADMRFFFGDFAIFGGESGQLFGRYQWAQVDVNDTGAYIAKSPLSPATDEQGIDVRHAFATITPNHTSDTQVTHHWIYRRSIPVILPSGAVDPATPELLDRWYRIAVTPVNTAVDDITSDTQAIKNEDITTLANEFLQSVIDVDDIIGMEGVYNERMLYLTKDQILLSDRLNPDAIDTRFTFKAFGDPTEKNLFLNKITNNQLLLATTKDLYEINGTLLDLPDGSLDIAVFAIGEKYPPICSQFAIFDGRLFYLGADGFRVTTGSNSTNISPQLALLFQGETRHGIPPVAIVAGDTVDFPLGIGHGNLYCTIQHTDLTSSLFIYNFVTNTFRRQTIAPTAIWATQNDRILLGFGDTDANFIKEFESGATAQSIFFQTIFDANGQPRNRKDTFTLKITADTGGVDVTVYIAKDKSSFVSLGTINSSSETIFYFDLSTKTLGFRYAVQLQAAALTSFYLYEVTIEYEPRPEQVNFLRIPNTNQGSYARKRWTAYAFVVDTLGNDVIFTSLVDSVGGGLSIVNKATKLTHIHFFTSDTVGTDLGGTLQSPSGRPFEFYGVNLEETVSEKLPTPVKYLVIPANDYGNPNRKRFTSYKFQINTRGADVRLTPRVDGTNYATATFNTSEKRTVEYFFDTSIDVTGIDTGGILESLASTPFEFYGSITPQQVELLPPRLKSLYTPNTNFGVAARKRLRTIPIIINTNGADVVFVPLVDGVELGSTTLNSSRKQTLYHYFTTDVFGTDFAGVFTGDNPFEFYEFGQPEGVEVLPVPKKYDQLQPLRLDKIGKLFGFRLRIITLDSSIPFAVYSEQETIHPAYSGTSLYSGSIPTVPNVDDIYEVQFPKSINADLIRIVLGPTTNIFHRYNLTVKVSMSGTETDSQWIPIQ